MKNEIDFSYYIERYLDGEMSAEEQHWFTSELKGNPSLKQELELRERLNEAIRETEILDFRKQLDLVFETSGVETEKGHAQKYSRRRLVLSLSAGLIILIGILVVSPYRNLDNKELYKKYFKPAEAGYTFRSEGKSGDIDLQTAMQLYESGNYGQALVLFEKILTADSSRIGLNLYSGISQMGIEKFQDANNSFHKIIDNNYILYLEQAEWYLAFCYLMTDNLEKAREQFAFIEKHQGYYKNQAKKILRRIN
jgi:hypothetical protein